jgi:hypothetical protein
MYRVRPKPPLSFAKEGPMFKKQQALTLGLAEAIVAVAILVVTAGVSLGMFAGSARQTWSRGDITALGEGDISGQNPWAGPYLARAVPQGVPLRTAQRRGSAVAN